MYVEIVLTVVVLCASFFLLKSKRNLPPGPWGFPVFGNIPLKSTHDCEKMAMKYGKIFMLKFGNKKLLYILDYNILKTAYQKMEFADRPEMSSLCLFREEIEQKEQKGIIFSNGNHWQQNRRFLLRHLRDLGMGKSKIEGIILKEIEALIKDFETLIGVPSQLPFSLNVSILNVIWQLVASKRYDFEDEKVKLVIESLRKLQTSGFLLGIPDCFPFVNFIIPKKVLQRLIGYNHFLQCGLEFREIVQPYIDDHEKNFDENSPRDLIDEYLLEMKVKKSEEFSHFSYADLMKNTFDLFIAGNDTTSNMVRWVLLYMAKFRDVQKEIQSELDKFVPEDEIPRLEHRTNLSYLDATINEVQRHCSMVAFGLMRSTSSDVTLSGYDIPKDTMVFSMASITHMDPAFWTDPENFDPKRFLDTKGKCINNCDGFQPFGIGKRQCLGEHFARMELYLIVGALLHKFTFEPCDGEEIDITPEDNFPTMHLPKNKQKFSIKLRH